MPVYHRYGHEGNLLMTNALTKESTALGLVGHCRRYPHSSMLTGLVSL